MCLIRALRDCQQRSLTVSKKAPTVSKKASPPKKSGFSCGPGDGEKMFTPGHLGVRVRNVSRKFDQKVYVYVVFSSLVYDVEPKLVRGLLGTDPWTPPSNPSRPPLLMGRFGIDSVSIPRRFDIDFLILPYFDAKLTAEEGRARRIRGWGWGACA